MWARFDWFVSFIPIVFVPVKEVVRPFVDTKVQVIASYDEFDYRPDIDEGQWCAITECRRLADLRTCGHGIMNKGFEESRTAPPRYHNIGECDQLLWLLAYSSGHRTRPRKSLT